MARIEQVKRSRPVRAAVAGFDLTFTVPKSGSVLAMLDAAYTAWQEDTNSGSTALLIAADPQTVTALNARAHDDRPGAAGAAVALDGKTARGASNAKGGYRVHLFAGPRGLSASGPDLAAGKSRPIQLHCAKSRSGDRLNRRVARGRVHIFHYPSTFCYIYAGK